MSAPYIQAMMVEQAGISPGMRILEIGSGGYNAALIAELVGEAGQVTTVDIDPEVVDRARSCLTALSVFGHAGGESMLRCCRGPDTESAFALVGHWLAGTIGQVDRAPVSE
ncbi:MAG: hypothetical protein ACRDT0_00835 [Pseudonocardiaceae bacterium]